MGRRWQAARVMEAFDARVVLDQCVAELASHDMDPPCDELRLAREVAAVALALRKVADEAGNGVAEALMARICGRLETMAAVVRTTAAGQPLEAPLGASYLIQAVELSTLMKQAAEILAEHRTTLPVTAP